MSSNDIPPAYVPGDNPAPVDSKTPASPSPSPAGKGPQIGAPVFLKESWLSKKLNKDKVAHNLEGLGYAPHIACEAAAGAKLSGAAFSASELAYHLFHTEHGLTSCDKCPKCAAEQKIGGFVAHRNRKDAEALAAINAARCCEHPPFTTLKEAEHHKLRVHGPKGLYAYSAAPLGATI
jgi:hypothetical protein